MSSKIRDLRNKQFFMVDDQYLNGYAKLCGIHATGVYMSLCRHSNKEQKCWPAKKTIAEELDISERSVYSGIKKLEEYGIIKIEENDRKKNGTFKSLTYLLLDKSQWQNVPSAKCAVGTTCRQPSARGAVVHRHVVPCKETHSEGNTVEGNTDIAGASPAQGEVIPDLTKDPQKHIQIIGYFALAKKITFTSVKHQRLIIKRNLRPASDLSCYNLERIKDVMRWLIRNAHDFKWTLDTVLKYIDEDLNRLKSNKNKIFVAV